MNRKYLILISIIVVFFISVTSAAAQENITDTLEATNEDTLETTYFYDAETGGEHVDDTVVTHNVVKYYGDKDKKFKVIVYDKDKNPASGVYVSFGKQYESHKEKTTNSKGIVYFPINYKPGTYYVDAIIESEDGQSYWTAYNTVKVKSTIQAKELVKYSSEKNKKFKIKFLTTKGKPLKNTYVKLKIKGKTYKVKTNSKGYAKIKLNSLKVGNYKMIAYNPKTGEKRKISVVILKKGVHKAKIRIDDPTVYFPTKKLKNGDYIESVYETKHKQYEPGVYVHVTSGGMEDAKHTKLLKVKFFFKNKKTGKIITKTDTTVKWGAVVKPVKGYSPYKATVWYKDKK